MAIKDIHIRVNDEIIAHKEGWEKVLKYKETYGGSYADAIFGILNNLDIPVKNAKLSKEEIKVPNKKEENEKPNTPKVKEAPVTPIKEQKPSLITPEPEAVKEEKKMTQEEYDKMSNKERLRALVKNQYAP